MKVKKNYLKRCYLFLGCHKKKIQYIYIYIYKKKKNKANTKYWIEKTKPKLVEKMMLECRKNTKIGWGGSKIQKVEIWEYIFNWWALCWQEKINLRKKSSKSNVYELN
jgi:hypothetical protein